MKAHGRVEVIAPPIFTSTLDGRKWSDLRPGRFTGWAPDPVRTLLIGEKSIALAGNQTSAVQPAACRYTVWAYGICILIIRSENRAGQKGQYPAQRRQGEGTNRWKEI
jgi:hypothetical protein